jgi:HNH endonuclease
MRMGCNVNGQQDGLSVWAPKSGHTPLRYVITAGVMWKGKQEVSFSKKTKIAAALYQGVDLFGKHADHIIPRSKGGSDDVRNCQILNPMLNIKKSNKMIELRKWQSVFREKWRAHTHQSFLLNAIPAGGKTIAALRVGAEFLAAGHDRCLIVVVPTRPLQTQWRKEAVKEGIELQTMEQVNRRIFTVEF